MIIIQQPVGLWGDSWNQFDQKTRQLSSIKYKLETK